MRERNINVKAVIESCSFDRHRRKLRNNNCEATLQRPEEDCSQSLTEPENITLKRANLKFLTTIQLRSWQASSSFVTHRAGSLFRNRDKTEG